MVLYVKKKSVIEDILFCVAVKTMTCHWCVLKVGQKLFQWK